ncbi:MAG: hypothetical protein ACWGN7_07120, partial [Thermodesulfovibrionales bacterium]
SCPSSCHSRYRCRGDLIVGGIASVVLGALAAILADIRCSRVLRTHTPVQIPGGEFRYGGVISVLEGLLTAALFVGSRGERASGAANRALLRVCRVRCRGHFRTSRSGYFGACRPPFY